MRPGKSIRSSVVVGLIMALLLGACSLGRDVPRVRISNLDDTSGVVQAPEPTKAGWSAVVSDLRNSTVTPTASGPIIVSGRRDSWGKIDRLSATQVVSLNPADGSVRWAATIEQPMESGLRAVHQERLEEDNEAYSQNPKDDSCDGVDCGLEC